MSANNPGNESPSIKAQDSSSLARVTRRIEPGKKGRVMYSTTEWNAQLHPADVAASVGIEEGAYVRVFYRQGNMLVVSSRIEDTNNPEEIPNVLDYLKAPATVVDEALNIGAAGRLKLNGVYWFAVLSDRCTTAVPVGAKVHIIGRAGTTLVVEPIESAHYINMGIAVSDDSSVEIVAKELATLCKALNAYHIACGGNGLEIDDWETLVAVRELIGA